MYERIMPRLGAATGALFVVLLFGASSTGSESNIVVYVELIALLLFIPFLAYLWSVLRDAEGAGGWLSTTALAAGLVGMCLDAEFGPAFLLFLLWILLASVVLTVRASGVRAPAELALEGS